MTQSKKHVVGVVAKVQDSQAQLLAKKLVTWLSEKHIPSIFDRKTAEAIGVNLETTKTCEREELSSKATIVVSLGGDGTLLSVARFPVENPPLMLGVNLGTLGFLTEILPTELFQTLEAAINGSVSEQKQFLLSTSVIRNGVEVEKYSALNDIVITKEALARVFTVEIGIDKSVAAAIRGDGIIVASPGGSTAYSLSAGGSIVHPQVNAILITPICPHSLTTRPLVIPSASTVSLTISRSKLKNDKVYLTIDGQEGMALSSGDAVQVTTSDSFVRLVASTERTYYQHLATKLQWATSSH